MFKSFNASDRKIFTSAAIIFLLAMGMTLSDEWLVYFSADATKDLQAVGSVESRQNDVRRRFKVEFGWSNLSQKSTVYQGDTIFTGNNSSTTIRTAKGDEITVAPNSLVVINTKGENISIEIEFGSIEGQIKSNDKIFISSQNTITELNGKNSKVRIDAGEGNSLLLDVLDGEVNINNNGLQKTLNKFDVAEVNSLGGIKDKDFNTLKLVSPLNDQRYRLSSNLFVPFKWESLKAQNRAFLKVATDPDFKNTILKTPMSNSSYVATNLPADRKLYWTVVAEGLSSEVGHFWVLDVKAPQLLSPQQGKHFYYDPDIKSTPGNRIDLTWAGGSPARKYEVQVSKDSKFQRAIQSFITEKNRFETPLLSQGIYFWRVRGLEFSDSQWSSVQQFKIGPEPSKFILPPAPSLEENILLITKSHNLNQEEFSDLPRPKIIEYIENPVIFQWSKVSGAVEYEIEVSRQKDLKNKIIDTKTKDPQFLWALVEPGVYYWRVRSRNEYSYFSSFTKVKKVVVSVQAPRITSKPIYIEEVNDLALMKTSVPPIEISWLPTVFSDTYEVIFSKDLDFKQPIQFLSKQNSKKLQLAEPGIYYWKIRTLSNKGNILSNYSPVNSIEFRRVYKDPRLSENLITLSPKMNDSLLLVGKGESEIVFEWSRPFIQANYELQISTDNSFEKIMFSIQTDKTAYSLKKKLPQGDIFWRVRAKKNDGITDWSTASRMLVSYEGTPYDAETGELILIAKRKAKERQRRIIAAIEKRLSKMRLPAGTSGIQLDSPEIINTDKFITLSGNFDPNIASRQLASQSAEDFYKQVKNPPQIKWTPVIAAERYFIEIAGDEKFNNIIEKQPSFNPYYIWEKARPGRFYVRIQAFNDRYTRSDYSKPQILQLEVEKPKNLSPESIVELMELPREMWAGPSPFKLNWSPRIFAKNYEFEFAEDKNFEYSKLFRVSKAEKEVQVSKSGLFYWRVRPLNSANVGISQWSDTFQVEVAQANRSPASTGEAEGLYPISRTIIQVGKGILDFAFYLSGGTQTEQLIELSRTAGFDKILTSVPARSSKTLIRLEQNIPDGKVYWRVRNKNSLRQPAKASKVYDFTLRREGAAYRIDK